MTTEYEFGFPFQPYSIQVDLMKCMTAAMDERRIGILESPTGTGKTLSIVCSSLSWLLRHHRETKDQVVAHSQSLSKAIQDMSASEAASGSDWVAIHASKKDLQEQKLKADVMLELISWKEKRDAEFRQRKENKVKQMCTQVKGKAAGMMLQSSSESNRLQLVKRKQNSDDPSRDQGIVSPESLDIEEVSEYVSADEEESNGYEQQEGKTQWGVRDDEEEEAKRIKPQIVYACRTHSQLAQFVNEVKKTAFSDQIRLVSLASRANLCVNPSVCNTKSVSLVNDRCMDMQRRGRNKKEHKCSFLASARVSTLADEILSDVQDIEQVHEAGKELSACPYYASRSALNEADLIVLPYNILIHAKTRNSYGIDLTESIVIIDEAHNLLDTITGVHSAEVSQENLTGCMNQLTQYVTRYNKRLSAGNLLYIKQLLFFVKSIVSLLSPNRSLNHDGSSSGSRDHHQDRELNAKAGCTAGKRGESAPSHQQQHQQQHQQSKQLFTVLDFILAAGIDNINLFKLTNYCEKSQLARKLFAFPTSTTAAAVPPEPSLPTPVRQLGTACSDGSSRKQKQTQQLDDGPEVTIQQKGDIDSPVAAVKQQQQASGTNAFLSRIKSNAKHNRSSSQKDKVKQQKAGDSSSSNVNSNKEAINDPERLKHIVQVTRSAALAATVTAVVTRNEITGRRRGGTSDSNSSSLTAKQRQSVEQNIIPTSPLYVIIEFMKCLTNPSADGRVLVTRGSDGNQVKDQVGSSLKYFLLNPSHHFRDIVTSCRSLILAGGTMKPFEEYTTLLFGPMGVPPERIITFSCGHVIPKENILPIALSTGPSSLSSSSSSSSSSTVTGPSAGQPRLMLNYSFAQRSKAALIEETGQILVRLSALTPGGIVVFFPSYEYLDLLFNRWESSLLLQQMNALGKRVFREPKKASDVTRILTEYCRANSKTNLGLGAAGTDKTTAVISAAKTTSLKPGGILLSVVGGKVSEGINFNDDMCRCVVMIGMPYSNASAPQLKEKMRFFDTNLGSGKGRFYYENLCFKAINQSIGRSIRHKDDYSVILLLDQRYSDRRDQVRSSLAAWIADHLIDSRSFAAAMKSIEAFFASKKRG